MSKEKDLTDLPPEIGQKMGLAKPTDLTQTLWVLLRQESRRSEGE